MNRLKQVTDTFASTNLDAYSVDPPQGASSDPETLARPGPAV